MFDVYGMVWYGIYFMVSYVYTICHETKNQKLHVGGRLKTRTWGWGALGLGPHLIYVYVQKCCDSYICICPKLGSRYCVCLIVKGFICSEGGAGVFFIV